MRHAPMPRRTLSRTAFFAIALLALAVPVSRAAGGGLLDDGTLDPAWSGTAADAFRETENVDYLWVKDGFTLQGRTLRIAPWEDFKFLRKDKRDTKDASKAGELTDVMPARLRGALGAALEGRARVSREDGDLVLTGRFVDVNAGSKAAKFLIGLGAGSATATWDMKITDATTGEVVVALHHRSISGTVMSEIDDKITKWLERFGEAAKADFAEFKAGKPRKK